ncbi:MAG: DUF6320 domain-containing protein [Clostridia bacterium]
MEDNFCSSCSVNVSSDLSNCPLCGKYVLGDKPIKLCDSSFPLYNTRKPKIDMWVKVVRNFFIIIAMISAFVNVVFPNNLFWSGYVLVSSWCLFEIFFKPFYSGGNYLKSFSRIAFFASILVIFIDAWNFYLFKTTFGWSVAYVFPFIVMGFSLVANILTLSSKIRDFKYFKNAIHLSWLAVIMFIVNIIAFSYLPLWPTVTSTATAIGAMCVVLIFKHKKFKPTLIKKIHV